MYIIEIENKLNNFIEEYDKQKTGNDCMRVVSEYADFIKTIKNEEIKKYLTYVNNLNKLFDQMETGEIKTNNESSEDQKRIIANDLLNFFMFGTPFLAIFSISELLNNLKNKQTPYEPEKQILFSGAMFDSYFIDNYKIIFRNFIRMCNDQIFSITSSLKIHKPQKQAITISISKTKGIYRKFNNKTLTYPIRSKKRRSDLIYLLQDGIKSNSELVGTLKKNYKNTDKTIITKSITDTNKQFKRNLDLEDEIILSLPTGGYNLNHEKFEIIFEN
ncbi:hypothetical protein L6270_00770 [Candidatus Parcubacteria bacterium]|nr:hypothetical protein [Patescibacteria group bacterium]MBU4309682.1 hypothetical protein [Patescibacteria group bacterium]MBU4431694.1 hypothetical protein [Patescibacteria group bacterium]MBU4577930.1 hypothetical protein [Patescibacteria group bacterium]MCG2696561.1 hypothetical protein [Candidatus Parcubacteria bacterium]